eukprot:1114585-Prorocentrum_minimum.AAC.1
MCLPPLYSLFASSGAVPGPTAVPAPPHTADNALPAEGLLLPLPHLPALPHEPPPLPPRQPPLLAALRRHPAHEPGGEPWQPLAARQIDGTPAATCRLLISTPV